MGKFTAELELLLPVAGLPLLLATPLVLLIMLWFINGIWDEAAAVAAVGEGGGLGFCEACHHIK